MNICPIPFPPHPSGTLDISTTVHRAGWVIASPHAIYKNGYVAVENGWITSVGMGSAPPCPKTIDHGPGVLAPALVNAHTHLELGALRNKISYHQAFSKWVATLLEKRTALSNEQIMAGIQCGIDELKQSGCAVIGDISSLGYSRRPLANSHLSGIYFREFLGNLIPEPTDFLSATGTLRNSLAGHAPHTTSPNLLKAIKKATRKKGLPMSIHLSESGDELTFILSAGGDWADFLFQRGIDFSTWGLPCATPVVHLDRLGILDNKTVAVHLLQARQKDFDLLAKHGVNICVCPRSNFNLHGKLPDISGMLSTGLNVCFGTDSLASVSTLSVWDEMKLVAINYPSISPQEIFAMATVNGARALGFETQFGMLKQGMFPAMLYLPVNASNPSTLLEKMVYGEED
ncbi:MAG: amidohydrolase family protein [Desulfobacterales bacterium]|nr:amidohydrolase family protein [Desulfobacterales bacterium]